MKIFLIDYFNFNESFYRSHFGSRKRRLVVMSLLEELGRKYLSDITVLKQIINDERNKHEKEIKEITDMNEKIKHECDIHKKTIKEIKHECDEYKKIIHNMIRMRENENNKHKEEIEYIKKELGILF